MSRLLPFFSFIVGTSPGWPREDHRDTARHATGRSRAELSRVADESRDRRKPRIDTVRYGTGWKQL